jgi:hypothetical protein
VIHRIAIVHAPSPSGARHSLRGVRQAAIELEAGSPWPEANAIINQKGVGTDRRRVVSADGQRHTTRTMFFYGEFVVFPVWVLRVDLIDDRVQHVRSGLNGGSITRVSHD